MPVIPALPKWALEELVGANWLVTEPNQGAAAQRELWPL